jgi:hypothetical protein
MDRDIKGRMSFETSSTLIPAHNFVCMVCWAFKCSTHELSGSCSSESEGDDILGCCTV